MRIGNVELENPVLVAPMAGVTDQPYRALLKEQRPGLIFTEMLSAKALVLGSPRTGRMCDLSWDQRPIGVQLFGREPDIVARAARIVVSEGADLIDINLGCPVPKLCRSGEGAALMLDSERAVGVVRAAVEAVPVPVTVKMRAGYRRGERTAVPLARMVVEAGAAAVTVHGRTRDEFYGGTADWTVIAEVRAAVSVPVIGNGDVFSPGDAQRMLEETGCAGVMVARGVLGNPWLVGRVVRALAGEEPGPEPDAGQRLEMLRRHIDLAVTARGERRAAAEMKKHAAWYSRGLPGASSFRREVMSTRDVGELVDVLERYRVRLEERRDGEWS